MTRAITKFFRLGADQRRLLLQAVPELARSRRALSRRPVRELIAGVEEHSGEVVKQVLDSSEAELAGQIGWAVRAAAAYTPWNNSCLVQVIAAQNMMRSRGVGGAIYLGAARGEGEEFAAHAWLKHGDVFVTGEAGHEEYQVLTTFSW